MNLRSGGKLNAKRKPKEEDFYLKITESGKTAYTTKVTKEDIEKGIRVQNELVEDILKALKAKSWNELEFIPSSKGENRFIEIRKK